MAEFLMVLKERERMCDSFLGCLRCPLGKAQKGTVSCKNWTVENPEDAERIIMQWSADHPIMTNRRKFEEVFGFTPATMFEVNPGNADWLDEEYKDGDGNDS